jgi:hypothetical protein
MPWLMGWLARLRRKQMIALLAAMPVLSLVPTLVHLCFFPDGGAGSRNWRTFIADTPLFWLPYFAAGMLLSRISGISRFERRGGATLWVAIVGVLVVSAASNHLLEKPLAKRLRRRFAAPEATGSPRELLRAS